MKTIITGLILILLLFTGCEKSEMAQLELMGTIKGKIYTSNEFGVEVNDNANVLIYLEGSDPLLSATTDSIGNYELGNIPTGTYNLIISKEGYGEYQRQGIQIVGGDKPLYINNRILEISSTRIENLSLEYVNTQLYLNGIIIHNHLTIGWGYSAPMIRYFIHTSDNPSDKNYLQTGLISFNSDSGSQFSSQISLDRNQFLPGDKVYLIAYGWNSLEYGYYDILSNHLIYTSVGEGSDIASITIPY